MSQEKKLRTFWLTEAEYDLLKLLGSGNASKGLREAIREARDSLSYSNESYLEKYFPEFYKEMNN